MFKSASFSSIIIIFLTIAGSMPVIVGDIEVRSAPVLQAYEIIGRIMTEDGQTVSNAVVTATSIGGGNPIVRTTLSDSEGNFILTGLERRAYMVTATSPGYVSLSTFQSAEHQQFYRPGEVASITLVRGGVITGQVTDINGAPVSGISVRALRITDPEGHPATLGGRDRKTDDRGVYRIYGLAPGDYLVMAFEQPANSSRPSEYDGKAPTFYPSNRRATAEEVTVRSGEEAVGINISFRGETGYIISGTFREPPGAINTNPVFVELIEVESGMSAGSATVRGAEGRGSFAIHGLADGEYELTAQRNGNQSSEAMISNPRRVNVRGMDVGGIVLSLIPAGSVSGVVLIEPARNLKACSSGRQAQVSEITLSLRNADASNSPVTRRRASATALPDSRGEFTFPGLAAARYIIDLRLPDENWFIRSIVRNPTRNQRPDAAPNSIELKQGEKLKGYTLTVAEGAASLTGRIELADGDSALPTNLRIYLIPAERERAEDLLRYAQVTPLKDGSFRFANLAPENYKVIARVAPEPARNTSLNQGFLDHIERANIRREAELTGIEIHLKPCTHTRDFSIAYSSAPAR